ncbi:MAG: hypothetical protein HY556_01830 [Euryarchaeota archaeon]|nr:hypothetical protein [Euryarchaeota archaeon]
MRERVVYFFGVALLVALAVTALAPGAEAALPPEKWSASTGSPNGSALATSKSGDFVIAGYQEIGTARIPGPANIDYDCYLLNVVTGVLAALPDDSESLDGMKAVAMSGDGNFSACGAGYDGSVGGLNLPGAPPNPVPSTDFWFFDNRKVSAFGNGENQDFAGSSVAGKLNPEWTKKLPGTINAIAINWDGTIVVVGTGLAPSNSTVYGFNKQGDDVWQYKTKGSVLSVAMNSTGEWIVAGARRNEESGPDQGKPFGEVLIFNEKYRAPVNTPAAGSRLLFNYTIKETVGGDITSISVSEDGKKVVAGTAGGKLYYFRNGMDSNGNGEVSPPQVINIGRKIYQVKVAANGSHVVVGDESFVSLYKFEGDLLVKAWDDQVFNPVVSADITPDGKYIVSVGQGAMHAYVNESSQAIWAVSMPIPRVAIAYYNNNLTRVAAAPDSVSGGNGQLRSFELAYETRLVIVNDEHVPFEVIPGAENHIAVQVRNNGSAYESYEVTIGNASGLGVTPNITKFSMRPTVDAYPTDIEVNMTLIPDFVLPGVYRYNVSVYAFESNTTTNVTVNVSIIPQNRLELRVPGGDLGGKPGESVSALITAKNLGNDRQVVTFVVGQKPPGASNWTVRLDPETTSVQPDSTASLNAIVTIPAGAADGDINVITLTGYAAEAVAKVQFKVIVNPQFDVRLEASPPTRVVNPGKTATIVVKITNTGTLQDIYTITQRLDIVGVAGWTSSFDKNQLTLARGASVSRDLTVRAPDASTTGDKLSVSVEAVGAGGSKDAVTMFFNAEPATTTGPIPTPGFEPFGLIGVGIIGALSTGRRRK